MTQYSRLIGSLIDECISAALGEYDVEDAVSGRAAGGDLIREVLVRTVCDPRFKETVRVAKAWEEAAQEALERFARELTGVKDLGREEAFLRMDAFLAAYFLTTVREHGFAAWQPPDGKALASAPEESADGEQASGEPAPGESDAGDRLADNLAEALLELKEEDGRGIGRGSTREAEQQAELRFLKRIPASLKKLARLIGRTGSDGLIPSGHYLSASKSDIAGITVGNDLGSLLPSEIALLAEPRTQDIFFRNYVGKRLQVFASASAGGGKPVRRQDGPVVICLDRSSSMQGQPSDIARALTMAVTIYAKRKQREVIIVKYGNEEQDHFIVRNLRRQRNALLGFLSYGCAGGNNEDTMFGWVFSSLLPREKAFDSADVLCISDFGWASVSDEVMDLIRANKDKGMKFYGLGVGSIWDGGCGRSPQGIIDSMWTWDHCGNRCYEEK